MSYYLKNLPAKKLEIIDEVSEYIGSQNLPTTEFERQTISQEFLNKLIEYKKSLVVVLDNSSFDAAAVLETMYDVERFCDVERDNDYRPHYYYLVDNTFISKWK
jgi:hypothetical protein